MQEVNTEVEVLPSSEEAENRGIGAPDGEARAIYEFGRLLTDLSPEARKRVLAWAVAFAGVDLVDQRTAAGTVKLPDRQEQEHPVDLPQLFEWAAPTKEVECALVACYFHTVVKGEESVDGATINSELGQMGRRSTNITKALSHLIEKRPSLVILAGRSGRGPQSRKQYRVTAAGVTQVRNMINANKGDETKH